MTKSVLSSWLWCDRGGRCYWCTDWSFGARMRGGFEADQPDLELDDNDSSLGLPPRGAKIRLSLGWEDSGLIDKGEYIIDEIEHSGAPDKLIVRARSADLRMGLLEKRERRHEQQSLGDLVQSIASEHDFTALCDRRLANELIANLGQTGESVNTTGRRIRRDRHLQHHTRAWPARTFSGIARHYQRLEIGHRQRQLVDHTSSTSHG